MELETTLRIVAGVLIGIFVYIYLAFATLAPTQAGIDFNMIRYTLGDNYVNGRHWLGVGHRFIVFPLNVQTFEFIGHSSKFKAGGLLRSRTEDGLEVQLEVSMQYQLDKDNIRDIYTKFGEDYEEVYVRLAIDTLNLESTLEKAFTFFNNRTIVEARFSNALQSVFRTQARCELQGFQLRSVSLPREFEQSIQNTEVQKQDIKMADAEVEWKTIEAVTKVLSAEKFANATVTAAEAEAERINYNVKAWVAAFNLTQGLASAAFGELQTKLDGDKDALVDYLWVRALRNHPASRSIVSIEMK